MEDDAATRIQPLPTAGQGPAIWDLVIADIDQLATISEQHRKRLIEAARARDAMGTAKYGHRLHVGDGRDHLTDAYQEALDLAVYLRQEAEAVPLPHRWRLYRRALDLVVEIAEAVEFKRVATRILSGE